MRCSASAHPYPDQHALAAAVGYLYRHVRGAGVEGVLAELLDHRGGAVDHLTGCELPGHEGFEQRPGLKDQTPPHVVYTRVILLVGSLPIMMNACYEIDSGGGSDPLPWRKEQRWSIIRCRLAR